MIVINKVSNSIQSFFFKKFKFVYLYTTQSYIKNYIGFFSKYEKVYSIFVLLNIFYQRFHFCLMLYYLIRPKRKPNKICFYLTFNLIVLFKIYQFNFVKVLNYIALKNFQIIFYFNYINEKHQFHIYK